MNTAALIVELVLTGMLMLAALLLPALGTDVLGSPPETALTLAIAIGFVLGVIVDRCADSILARWEGVVRCNFAVSRWVATERERLLRGAPAKDPFPEDFLQMHFMTTASEGLMRTLENLRIRLRIARTASLLTPAIATSAVLALCTGDLRHATVFLPGLHIVHLAIAFAVSYRLKSPRTPQLAAGITSKKQIVDWLLTSAATVWFALEAATAIAAVALVARSCDRALPTAIAIVVGGSVLTALAVATWTRISRTYMELLFRHCLLGEPDGLRRALAG